MTWFEKIMPSRIKTERRTRSVPEGLWMKCAACDAFLYRAELERNLHVCPKCGHHMRIGARDRLEHFLDPESGVELANGIEPEDPLKFRDSKKYRDQLLQAQKSTGEKDAFRWNAGSVLTTPMQLGPTMRMPAVRTRSRIASSCARPSTPVSAKPALMTTIAPTRFPRSMLRTAR